MMRAYQNQKVTLLALMTLLCRVRDVCNYDNELTYFLKEHLYFHGPHAFIKIFMIYINSSKAVGGLVTIY